MTYFNVDKEVKLKKQTIMSPDDSCDIETDDFNGQFNVEFETLNIHLTNAQELSKFSRTFNGQTALLVGYL